jgi:hypothetical protein
VPAEVDGPDQHVRVDGQPGGVETIGQAAPGRCVAGSFLVDSKASASITHLRVSMGVSGRTKLILGSAGFRYERGTTGEITLRRLEGLPQIKTRCKRSTIGVGYSAGLLF